MKFDELCKSMGVTPEEVAELEAKSGSQRIFDLLAKIEAGAASPEEQAEFDDLTKHARELDPNVLKG